MARYFSCNAESAVAVCDPYIWDYYRRKKSILTKTNIEIIQFHYTDLLSATDNFSSDTFLGKGSHGSVYRSVLDNGKLIAAVKKTKTNCNSPADNEIEILSRVYHPSFVNLIGYCSDALCKNKLIVVEYMPNGSLHDLLHSSASRPLGWSIRVRFVLQVTKAVQALLSANPPVIRRDIKSSNVLIDQSWNARLSDFGLALRGNVEDIRAKCTPPAGTLGYLDPGYLTPSDLSTKSDVFSYGILLLEIISGRHAIDLNYSPPSIVDWAVPLIKKGDFSVICDGRLGQPVDKEVIRNLAMLVARCVSSTGGNCPGMAAVVESLEAVRQRNHSGHVWSNLRRRVKLVDHPLVKNQVFEGSKEVVRSSRCGSWRNSRKVSSVTSAVDHDSEVVGDRGVKSKSTGSLGEAAMMMELGPAEIDLDSDDVGVALVRKKPGATVKMPVLKLSKSRSVGVLQSPKLTNQNSKKYVTLQPQGLVT